MGGEASPGEFPWTCLVLNQNNDFIGSCAVIPNDSSNNNGRGTRKVVTAAHKLKNIQQNELLKIRVGEYDASGFNPPERDLRWRPGGEGRLHGRRRKSPRLPGTFRKMDCCRPCHLGGGMCQRCPWSLCQDATFHSVDRPELNLFICMNNLIKRWEFLLIPEQ